MKTAFLVFGVGVILTGPVIQIQAAPRMVVLEEWTNTGWYTCPLASSSLDSIAINHESHLAVIRTHYWQPDSTDIFFASDRTEDSLRVLYYKPWYLVGNSWIYAVPWAHIDGKSRGYDYHTSYWSQYVTSESQVESPLTLTLSGWYNPSTLKGRINVHLVNSDSQAQRNSHFRYALTESGLHFNAPNGERLFNQVLRRYYSNGPDTLWMQDGDTVTIAGNATLDRGVDFWTRPSWDADSCQLVVFVQQDTLLSDSSRPILQGAKVWLRELSQTGVEYGKPAELNPGEVVLAQNRSNPFRETSEIKFSLPKAGDVCLALYDVQGRLVRKLVERIEQAGTHSITVSGLGSGVYFYRLEFGTASLTRRMVVAK